MKLGIIGLPSAGKTTIFNALTKGDTPTGQSVGGRFDVVTAIVDVPDERVDILTDMYKPKKTAYARVTYNDIAGIQQGADKTQGLSPAVMNHLAGLDGFVHVVRAFESDLVPHPDGSVDPLRDLKALDTDLLFSDLVGVESRLEKLRHGLARGAFKNNKSEAETELKLFEKLHEALSAEKPLRTVELTDDEEKSIRGYGFLTLKPVLVIINLGDEQEELDLKYEYANSKVGQLRGKLEMELSQMEGDDLEMFMEEYGVTELGLDRAIAMSYDLMGLQSFFTVGADEVRAWTIKTGATAVDAAGTIHSDLAKGFIRAEVVSYDDLMASGGEKGAKNAGKYRLEGKTYLAQDGDIMNIKFNV
jgi:GTP-binding protein YchF